MEATVVVDTSMTLSAMSASLLRSIVVSAEATTILIFGDKRRNNSVRKELESAGVPSLPQRSCYIRQSNCLGLQLPSSSPPMSCCNFRVQKLRYV